jgi:hypothetical protein
MLNRDARLLHAPVDHHGSLDSLCMKCFRTAAHAESEVEVLEQEGKHRCAGLYVVEPIQLEK